MEKKKREETQKAADEFDDCRVRAQNEYDTKLNLVNTLTLTPLQRVYAASRLKQNLDAERKVCRSQYESCLKQIEGQSGKTFMRCPGLVLAQNLVEAGIIDGCKHMGKPRLGPWQVSESAPKEGG